MMEGVYVLLAGLNIFRRFIRMISLLAVSRSVIDVGALYSKLPSILIVDSVDVKMYWLDVC